MTLLRDRSWFKAWPKISPRWIKAAQWLVLIGLFVLLWQAVDGRAAFDSLLGADLRWIAASALVLTVQTVLSALRWQLTARQLGISINPANAVREYYLAQFVNQALPGGVIGDAGRAVRSRQQAGLASAAEAVVFERLAGQIGLLAVFLVALAAFWIMTNNMAWPNWLIWPVATALGLLCAFCIALWGLLVALGPGDHRLRRLLYRLYVALAAPSVLPKQIAFSLGTAICNIMAFAFCAFAVGVHLPVLAIATLVPLILFSMVVPLTIGGWGVREGAAVLLFPIAGASGAQGLATSVAFGLVIVGAVLPGLALSWLAARRAEQQTRKGTTP